MKLIRRSVALALFVLLLAGCSAKAPSPPSPVDLSEEVMAHVENLLAGEPHLWQQLPNGSGPNSASLVGYEEDIKALFSSREWTVRENAEETASIPEQSWQWGPSIQLYGYDSPGNTIISFGEDYIYVRSSGGQNGIEANYYAAETAGSLPQELFDLYDGPNLRYAMVGIPASEAADFPQVMPLFAKRFEELYLESGAITDFELTALEPIPGSKHSLHLDYFVRPANPDAPYWKGQETSDNGMIHLSHKISLYLYEDDQWHMDYMQKHEPSPSETPISQETIDFLNEKYGLEPPPPSPIGIDTSAGPGVVLLTFADRTMRIGVSADDDVTIEIPGKGGAQLLFHLSEEELDWAETVEFQQATVRFGSSEWEHPGELYYNREKGALEFHPYSSSAQAYTYYGNEVNAFLLENKDFANPEVLSYVDQVLAADGVTLRCWLSNGSGPCPLSVEDYKAHVRSIFAGYEWKPLEEPLPSPDWTPEQWSIQLLNDTMDLCLSVSNAVDQLSVSFSGNGSESKHYTAKGAAELCSRLADLHPGPEARLLLTAVPADTVSGDQELAQAYAAAFEEKYLASRHIERFELHTAEPLPADPPDSIYRHVLMDFSVTPNNPFDPYWSGLTPQSDGSYRFALDVSILLYDNGIYRGDWLQAPDLIR